MTTSCPTALMLVCSLADGIRNRDCDAVRRALTALRSRGIPLTLASEIAASAPRGRPANPPQPTA